VFLSDDMGWEQVGFTGGVEVKTPNIDRIAREGVALTQFYVQPVCSPTRACLMTGRYAWKNGGEIRPTARSSHGMLRDERTIAEALREAGYATWMTGKWHLGEWFTDHLPTSRGFDHHYGQYGASIDSFTHRRGEVLDWHRNRKPVIEEGYSTFLLADECVRLIRAHDAAKPFFLYVPFNAAHAPHLAPEEYVRKYETLGRQAAQRAQVECMDIAVGRVMEAIREKGIDGRTLVMFTNDNGGPHLKNGPYKGEKSAYHEGGIRVPAAMRWPGAIRPDTKTAAMLHVTDLFPTFCGLAGAVAERALPLDGRDAWAAIAKSGASPRKEIAHSTAVLRDGDWKLIEEGTSYYNWPNQPLQLYDIERDPGETRNLASERPEIVKRLRERLAHHKRFAREGEKIASIPNFPPAVYGEEEERLYGADVRKRLGAPAAPARQRKKKAKARA
jgi:arylsulfatase A-like enzyme